MKKLILWLSSKPVALIVVIGLAVRVLLAFITLLIQSWYEAKFGHMGGIGLDNVPVMVQLFFIVVLAPMLETAIFQMGVIYLLQLIKKIPVWIPVVVSGALFAATHDYSWLYVILAFVSGVWYAILFLAGKEKLKKDPLMTFWIVCAVHSLYNLVTFFTN